MTEVLSLELAARTDSQILTETVLLAVINVAALSGNLLTLYAVYKNQRLRTLPNMFVISLAVSDILMSTCCMPFTVLTLFHSRWMFGERFCRFQGFEALTIGTNSLGTMGIIAVSRYFCVVRPEKYPLLFKKEKSLGYIVVVWCLALAGSVPPFFFKGGTFDFQPGKAMCLYTFESNISYTISIECFYIATPLTIIIVCYVKVFRRVLRSNRVFCQENNLSQLRANVEEAKVTKTLVAVLVGFACCWLPISVMDNIDAARGEHTLPRQAYLTYSFLAYISSTINPFIYGCMNKQFRREYKVVFKKILCLCRRNTNDSSESGGRNFFTRAWSIWKYFKDFRENLLEKYSEGCFAKKIATFPIQKG